MTLANWLKSLFRKTATIKYRRGKTPNSRRRRLLCCEWLEDRIVPLGGGGGGGGGVGGAGTLYWQWNGNAGDGNWDNPGNWSFTPGSDWNGGQANTYPGLGLHSGELDFATIDTGSTTATITIRASDGLVVQGLTTTANDTLSIIGFLTLEANSNLDGPLSLAGGTMTATGTGVTVTANGTTTATAAGLFALGGATLNLPNLNTYDNATSNATTLQALGSGSLLELPGLASLGALASTLNLSAQQGGIVDASALTLNGSTPNIAFDAEGSGSQINISPTALDGDSVFLDEGGTIPLGQLSSFTNGSLDVVGESLTLSVLTDADGSSLTADGGATVSFPNLISSNVIGATAPSGSFAASGAGSLLDVSSLSTVGGFNNRLSFQAQQGGEVDVSGLASSQLSNQIHTLTLGSGGTIAFSDVAVSLPTSVNAPTIVVPALPQSVTVDLDFAATGAIFNIAAGDTVDVTGGTFTGGATFNVGAGATVNLTGDAGHNQSQFVSYSGTLTGSGAGTVQFIAGRLTIGLGGLTLDFPSNMFQWRSGILDGALGDAINLGTINLSGGAEVFADYGTLDDYGTIVQASHSEFYLASLGAAYTTLKIEAGGIYLLGFNDAIGVLDGGITEIENAGTIRHTGGDADITVAGPISNTGTIESDSGTLDLDSQSVSQVSGNILTAGTWDALNGSTLAFPGGTDITTNQANVTISGSGAAVTGLSGLSSNEGSLTVTDGATFTTAGHFSNSGILTVGAGSTLAVSGNYTQTSAGTLTTQLGGTPASGQFGQVAVTGSAALAGAFGLSLVNGFGPTAGQDFKPLTYASATGAFARLTGLNPFFTATFNPTALDLIDGSTNAVDLVASSVTAPTAAIAGQQMTVNWQVNNPGTQAAFGSWQDSVYISTTPSITSNSILLGATTHTGGLAAGGSYTGAWTGAVPALLPGFYYLLVQVDSLYSVADPNRSNNTLAASTGQLGVTLPALTLGKPYADAFTAADQDHYYQLTVPAGGTLVVSLASAASSGGVALYIGQGTLPTPYSSQQAATALNQPNQTVTVPQILTAGTYYILAHSVSGAAASAGYTLTATQSTGLTVSAPVTPYTGGNGGNVTIEIDGTDFTPAITANLTLPGGTPIPASAIDFVSASQIYATFGLSGAAIGNYVLTVAAGLQSAVAPTKFQVVAAVGSGGLLTLGLSLPSLIRSGRTASFVVTYTNTTNNDIVAQLLNVSSTNPEVFFSTPDDPNAYTATVQVLAVAASGPAGILRPGQSGQITLSLLNEDTGNGDSLPVSVNQIEAGQTIDWASQMASLQPAGIPTAAWNVIFGNILATVGATTDAYNAALAQVATYLGSLGETQPLVSDVNHLWSFLVSQADSEFPDTPLASAVDASLSTPGALSLALDRTFQSSITSRYQQGLFGMGWITSWQTSLSADSLGNVTIAAGGSYAYFAALPGGTFEPTETVYGTLTLAGDVYTYTDTSGDQYVFRADDKLGYEQDTNGNRITLGYNGQDQLVTLTYSNPSDASEPAEQLTLTYNAQGFVSQEADGTGDIWTYTYDTTGHLLSVTAPGNLTTTYTYAGASNPETANALLSITNPDSSQENVTYDPTTGRLTGASQNGGADPVTYTYPDQAEVTATDAAGDQSTVWFNDRGLPARVEDPLGGISTYQYDANANLISSTDAAGDTYRYTYDTNGKLAQTVNPLGQTVHMTYDGLGDLTSFTDAAGTTTQYNYSSAGNLLSIAYPDGTSQSFTYDPLGNLSETVLQNGDAIGYKVNAQGLMTQQTFADGTSQTFTYDAHGNLLTANSFDASGNPTGTTTLTYNVANELTSIVYPNGQHLDFTYNAQGQRTQSVDQSGYTVNYSYDALGRLSQLTNPPQEIGGSATLIVQYTYNNLGQLQQKLNGNGTYTTYGYDAAGDLTQEVNYAGGITVNSLFTYTYNVLGEQTSMTDAAGNLTSYGYDATGQLTSVTLPGGATIQYVYNAAGDRTEVLSSGVPTGYASNADNEITQVGSTTYTYDPNGNLRTVTDASGTTTYTYNDLNQLISISAPDGTVTRFQYSPLGFLVGTIVTDGGVSSQTNYLVDPTGLGNVVGAYNGDGSLIADYTYGLGLVSQTGPKGTGFYDFDASGNTTGITGSTGAYLNRYSYLPFGETTTASAALPNPFTFAGQVGVVQVSDSLFSMRARQYTPVTGQFLSSDPTGLAGGDVNLRRYVGNNPVAFVDPAGLEDFKLTPGSDKQLTQEDQDTPYVVTPEQDQILNGIAAVMREIADPSGLLPNECGVIPPFGSNVNTVEQANIADNAKTEADKKAKDAAEDASPPPKSPPKQPRPPGKLPSTPTVKGGGGGGGGLGSETAGAFGSNSRDPNALIGPGGYGTQNFLQPTGTWPYTIDFENDGSAAALVVTVTEQLNSNLDWTTFQLGSFGWGSVNVTVPTGLTQYQTTVSYENSDGTPLNVLVTLDFNVQTGLLTATFTSLDPLTGETPAGVFDGFLYPEDGSGDGEGYIQYSVQPKVNLATGTVINQQASVVFDTNAALATDASIVTIDSGAPSSSVTTLPAYSPSSFTVAWSGQDDTGGSGIASYDVYVSDDNGPFTLWQQDVTQTSATFTGQNGHTYGFYSIATDNVGNVQPTPSAAQATTIVDTIAPTSSVSALPTFSPGSFTLSWSGSDNTGGSGLASYSVYVSDNGGTFTPFVTDTAQTSATFTGQNGHTYGFYSIATDVAGNVQATPSAAQATTTVDSVTPSSSVTALPTYSLGNFTLSWSGSDNTGGSGLASFSVYFSDNGGAFTPLLTNTTKTSITFTGQNGHVYGFYIIATDVAGNVQTTPSSAQATTTVDSVAPTSSVSALPTYSLGSFTLSWSGSDNSGGSGLASYTVYVSDNNGAFTPLLTNTTKTSTTFTGQNGHTYGFYSIATDVAGNVQPTPKSAQASTIVESVPPPAPSISSGPGSTSSSSSATFVFSDSQGGVTFLSKLDNGSYAAATSPETLNGLSNGSHTFYVEAKDQAGNISSATSYGWTISSSLAITSTQIDDGTKQRSMVRSLTLTFNASIASTLSGVMSSLTLIRASDGLSVGLQGSLDSTGKVLTLTFTGSSIVGGSLADGRYTLSWAGTTVLSSSQLWRLFGDLYGTASVTSADQAAFNAAMNTRKGMSNYSAYFDFDENGWVTNNDQTEFKKRMGTSI